MTAGMNRVRLAVEQMEDRCTPSAIGGGSLAALFPAHHGGPHAEAAAHVRAAPSPAHHGGPHAEAAARVRAAHVQVVPFKMDFQCSVDLNSLTVSSTGFSTFGTGGLVEWTSLGHADKVNIDLVRDRGVYSGTGILVTATGDKLFYSFTTSWRLSTGKGTHTLTATGGTGQFAGASGGAFGVCTITADPASPSIFHCKSTGIGVLFMPR